MIASLFYNPVTINSGLELWLVLPLCAVVGLVYKAVRVENLRSLPMEFLRLMVYMAVGLTTLCLVLWLIHTYWPSGN